MICQKNCGDLVSKSYFYLGLETLARRENMTVGLGLGLETLPRRENMTVGLGLGLETLPRREHQSTLL